MPPVPDCHTGGFVIYRQTYFCKSGMSRNGYAGLCGAEIIFDDQSFRSIAPQSITT
jgi:hypothetical protein